MVPLLLVFLVASQAWEVSIHSVSETTLGINVINIYDQPITLNVWDSPLDKNDDVFRADLFNIADANGNAPTYIGIRERKLPTLSSFITLQPNQQVQTSLDLTKGYWFPAVGDYKLSLDTMVRVRFGEIDEEGLPALSTFEWQPMTSNLVKVQVPKVLSAPYWLQANSSELLGSSDGLLGGPNPIRANCNSGTQVNQITTSGSNAIRATQQGLSYLPSGNCQAKTGYLTWFGSCDNNRYTRVRNCLSNTISSLQANYPVDCAGSSCTSNTYAYVFPSDSTHTVYVCAVFWRVPTNNCVMDSQPGTLIHEHTHFNNVCQTGDVTYGQQNCKNLANSNPAQAVNNADNYCFYTDSCYS